MLIVTNWAMIQNEMTYITSENWILSVIGAGIFGLSLWMTVETVLAFFRIRDLVKTREKELGAAS